MKPVINEDIFKKKMHEKFSVETNVMEDKFFEEFNISKKIQQILL